MAAMPIPEIIPLKNQNARETPPMSTVGLDPGSVFQCRIPLHRAADGPGIAAAAILCFLCACNDSFVVSGLTAGAVKG
jgi:hypothetical protein